MIDSSFWHLLAFGIYVGALYWLRKGFVGSTSWFALGFAIQFSGNILAYPLGLLGVDQFEELLNSSGSRLHGEILLLGMLATLTGHLITKQWFAKSKKLNLFPEILIPEVVVRAWLIYLSIAGAVLALVLSAIGYHGYFVIERLSYVPPFWLDAARKGIDLVASFSLLLALSDYHKEKGRLSRITVVLSVAWIGVGFVSGFKTLVIMPALYLALAAWISRSVKVRHFVLLGFLIVAAYAVVEPLRDIRQSVNTDNALEGVATVIRDDEVNLLAPLTLMERFLSRADYTATGVSVLELNEVGGVEDYKDKLWEAYETIPLLAFVPRLLWADKPLADLGRELAIALFNVSTTSVTPSQIVASYLWGGFLGVIINNLVLGIAFTLAGQLMVFYSKRPISCFPMPILAFGISLGDTVMAYYYVACIRALVALMLFYFVSRALGWIRPMSLVAQR